MFRRIVFVLVLALPVAAWAFVKPVRVLVPELAGVTCVAKVCVDDPSRLPEATSLYDEAVRFVEGSLGKLQTAPKAIFCSTQACSRHFGFSSARAYNVGTVGIVFSHRGWQPYFVRHELIHHLQNERLGSIRAVFFKPDWFREGMAYSLSQDPRPQLSEPLQGYRSRFESWYKQVGAERLWVEAESL